MLEPPETSIPTNIAPQVVCMLQHHAMTKCVMVLLCGNQNKFLHVSNAIEPQVCINCLFEIKTLPQPMVIICLFRI
jgi:hypothetical protein